MTPITKQLKVSENNCFKTNVILTILGLKNDVHITTARDLVTQFGSGLEGHVYGSPKLVSKQMDVVSNLVDSLVGMITEHGTKLLSDSSEESVTFLDLPKEILSEILKRVQDHVSILEAAKASEVLNALVTQESRLWRSLANFHFTQEQIQKHSVSGQTRTATNQLFSET
jgi:hypothetical protein